MRDLFAKKVDEAPLWDRDPDYDPYAQNPLVAFVRKELAELSPKAELSQWYSPVGPHYRICVGEAEELVGGDERAVEAILSGVASLSEMLKELKDSTPEARAEWAKKKSDQYRKTFDDIELDLPAVEKESDA